jgi:hypothetical protein
MRCRRTFPHIAVHNGAARNMMNILASKGPSGAATRTSPRSPVPLPWLFDWRNPAGGRLQVDCTLFLDRSSRAAMFWHIASGPSSLLMKRSANSAPGGISLTAEFKIMGRSGWRSLICGQARLQSAPASDGQTTPYPPCCWREDPGPADQRQPL